MIEIINFTDVRKKTDNEWQLKTGRVYCPSIVISVGYKKVIKDFIENSNIQNLRAPKNGNGSNFFIGDVTVSIRNRYVHVYNAVIDIKTHVFDCSSLHLDEQNHFLILNNRVAIKYGLI